MNSIEEKAFFNIGSNEYYEGYHQKNRTWNGWATPYFEKRISDLIAHNFSTNDYKIEYSKKDDCYDIVEFHLGKEVMREKAEKHIIITKEGKKEVYDFGSVGWTWDSYTFDEVKQRYNAHIIFNDEEKKVNIEDSINIDY